MKDWSKCSECGGDLIFIQPVDCKDIFKLNKDGTIGEKIERRFKEDKFGYTFRYCSKCGGDMIINYDGTIARRDEE